MQGKVLVSMSLTLLVALGILSPLFAQVEIDEEDYLYDAEFGLVINYGFQTLSGDLDAVTLSGDPALSSACGTFQEGSGKGLAFTGTFSYYLSSRFRTELAVSYANYAGTMRFGCVDPAEIRMPDGSLSQALTDHIITLDRKVVQGELGIWFKPLTLPIEVGVGGFVGVNLEDGYTLHEEIVEPINAKFTTGGQQRVYGTGTMGMSGDKNSVGLTFGLATQLPAGTSFILRPQMRYYFPVSDPFNGLSFRESSLRLGIQIARQILLFPPEEATPLEPGQQ